MEGEEKEEEDVVEEEEEEVEEEEEECCTNSLWFPFIFSHFTVVASAIPKLHNEGFVKWIQLKFNVVSFVDIINIGEDIRVKRELRAFNWHM